MFIQLFYLQYGRRNLGCYECLQNSLPMNKLGSILLIVLLKKKPKWLMGEITENNWYNA